MRPTIGQLRGWNLDALGRAAEAVGQNASELDGAVDRAQRIFDAAQWSGQTRNAARTKLDQEVDHAHEVRNLLQTYADEAADAARELGAAKTYVLNLVDHRPSDLSVSDTGEVTASDPERKDEAAGLQAQIQSGLNEVERLDGHYGPVLGAIAADLASIREGQRDVALPGGGTADPDAVVDRLAGMTPDQRAAFLAQMSPADVRQLVLADPERMGNLNGVPFAVRIAANEINIRNALVDEKQEPEPDKERITQLERMIAPINDPTETYSRDRRLGPGEVDTEPYDDKLIDRKFVSFSVDEQDDKVQMVEMFGSIEPGIRGAAVYVPGTNTEFDESNQNTTAAWNLAHESGSPVFLFMEGDFPQSDSFVDVVKNAGDPDYAEDMAPRLVGFGRELDREIAANAPGTKTTYIGHSYGGAVVGTAEQLGLRADRVLHASSAGTGIYEHEWRNPNPDVQRFSMTAPGDPIGVVQSADAVNPVSDPPLLRPVRPLFPGDPGPLTPLGNGPMGSDPDEAPGVTRLDTGYYSADFGSDGEGSPDGNRQDRAGEVVFGQPGHGEYWNDRDSTAFQNMVGVVTGGEVRTYVERGVESNGVDVNPGDDGNFAKETYDAGRAAVSGQGIGPFRVPGGSDPYGDPEVTHNRKPGPIRDVE